MNTNRCFKYILLLGGMLIVSLPLQGSASELTIVSQTDKTSMQMGEQLTLSIKVSGSMSGSIPAPSLPSHKGFDIIGAPRQSSNYSWINGQVSSSKTLTYSLLPQTTGKFIIGVSTINIGGKTYSSSPITITVQKAPTSVKEERDDEKVVLSSDTYGRILVSASLAKEEVYLGEGVLYTFSFFRKVRLWQSPGYDPPKFTDFWAEDLPATNKSKDVMIKGQRYIREDIKKILYPTREGTLNIGSTVLSAQIDPFAKAITVSTMPLTLEVLPLPEEPEGFSGAVGNYTLKAKADKTKVKEGDPVTVKVTIAGVGNVNGLPQPLYEASESFSGYEPKDSVDVSTLNDMITGTKTFEYLFIPLESGNLTLPSFTFTYFDPQKKSYKKLETKKLKVSVKKSESGRANVANAIGGANGTGGLIKKKIRPIRMKSDLTDWNPKSYLKGSALFLLLIPPLIAIIAFLLKRSAKKRGKASNPYKQANKKLIEAERFIDAGDYKSFFSETVMAFTGYFIDIMKIKSASVSKEELIPTLSESGCPKDLHERIEKALVTGDMGRFSPTRYGVDEMEEFYHEIISIIKTCEELRFWKV